MNCHTQKYQFVWSIWVECQFAFGVNGPKYGSQAHKGECVCVSVSVCVSVCVFFTRKFTNFKRLSSCRQSRNPQSKIHTQVQNNKHAQLCPLAQWVAATVHRCLWGDKHFQTLRREKETPMTPQTTNRISIRQTYCATETGNCRVLLMWGKHYCFFDQQMAKIMALQSKVICFLLSTQRGTLAMPFAQPVQ